MFRPYKSNLLDCWLPFNLAYKYFTMQHLEITGSSVLVIFLFFLTFFIVLIYHLLFDAGQLKETERIVNDICTKVLQYLSHRNHKYCYHLIKDLMQDDANVSHFDKLFGNSIPILASSSDNYITLFV